jgi:hypothetical protein
MRGNPLLETSRIPPHPLRQELLDVGRLSGLPERQNDSNGIGRPVAAEIFPKQAAEVITRCPARPNIFQARPSSAPVAAGVPAGRSGTRQPAFWNIKDECKKR